MKSTSKLPIFAFTLLALAGTAYAQSLRERQAEQRFIASLEGAKYEGNESRDEFSAISYQIEITQGKIHGVIATTWVNPQEHLKGDFVGHRAFGLA